MKTIVKKTDPQNIDMDVIEEGGEILRKGGLVAFPLETVYGLGADAMRAEASLKIYAAKGRSSDNPLVVHIADIETLDDIVSEIPESAKKLMQRFWPGPLTLIFNKKENVPYETTGGLDTVAVRMPSHPVALALIKSSGLVIAATSANTSYRPSPTKAKYVIDDMYGKMDMIIDGGTVGIISLKSTIVNVTQSTPMLLRVGYITKSMLEEIVGNVSLWINEMAEDSVRNG
ncbi:MAG: hypothetical protein APF81_01175 [Desulfosporosinus sp. BRH_c37]|nr:MAG: hypothetical protein APF81_01175 [Desulfosporosinus sp. BRH_c37]